MKLDWKSILYTAVIAIVAVALYNAFLKSWLQQIPVIGQYL